MVENNQAGSAGTGAAPQASGLAGAANSAAKPLQSLTPSYDETQHGTYLRRLEEAVKDPKNLNIALTGRYGAGKSSVLDKFQANHRKSTQRLAISTLAPGEDGETTTNRIQKEIVKQLLYGASKKVGKNSRFTKIAVLTKRRAVAESVLVVGCFGMLLYLLGWLPKTKWTGADESTSVHTTAWVGVALLATLAVSVVRMVTFGRFLSDVSAGGAGLSLADKPDTFFDKYLDEIVHYFSREAKDIVIFEDLDRFEDPHIFEALRELNVLLNETPERQAKRRESRLDRGLRALLSRLPGDAPAALARKLGVGTPLRFVYAVKDSIFEKLDSATANAAGAGEVPPPSPDRGTSPSEPQLALNEGGGVPRDRPLDAAATETLRANRTKFFDIVIPLVPFISHRTARDLLVDLLVQRGVTGIEPRLINTVAQHSTDMRLLRNMCNEYLVFAERLLESGRTAPGMDASHLFALIAYKNFHLEDFENITRRASHLDRLYDFHLRLVRGSIKAAEERKRALLAGRASAPTQAGVAQRLSAQLRRYAGAELRAAEQQWGSSYPHAVYKVGTKLWSGDATTEYTFWAAVARAQSLTVLGATQATGGQTRELINFNRDELTTLYPEGLNAERWNEYDSQATQSELTELEYDMERLRRADFNDLVSMSKFTLSKPLFVNAPGGTPSWTFEQMLTATLTSQLACDLVCRGYIDRNFSLYAAQFYGQFTGVEVANFMVQHVQTNTSAVDYDLSRTGAVANLLDEADDAGEELLRSVAAYNIDIVNHLLVIADPRSEDVIDHLVTSGPDDDARSFLAAYFTAETAQRTELAARLAAYRWREVFTYLVQDDSVPADVRPALVSAALCAFEPDVGYRLGDDVRSFVTTHYRAMPAFIGPRSSPDSDPNMDVEVSAARVTAALVEIGVSLPELAMLDDHLRPLVVEAGGYALTADNLRSALGITGAVSLDNVQQNQTVYDRCLSDLPAYLAAIYDDADTVHAVVTPAALVEILDDLATRADDEVAAAAATDLAALLSAVSPDAEIRNLKQAPERAWSALADARLFRASLANVELYRTTVRSIDTHLATLVNHTGSLHVDEPGDTTAEDGAEWDREEAAIALINAKALEPAARVTLGMSVGAAVPLPVDNITAEASDLFALLLDRAMIADDETSFAHFHAGGWTAVGPAIAGSAKIGDFIKPALVDGMVGELLTDPACSAKLGKHVVSNVEEFVTGDDYSALKAVSRYADSHQVALAPDAVLRIARVRDEYNDRDAATTVRLLAAAIPAASADQIVDVFASLGRPYDRIARPGEKLEFPFDATHDQLLNTLRTSSRLTRSTPRGKRHYKATVTGAGG